MERRIMKNLKVILLAIAAIISAASGGKGLNPADEGDFGA
jgi:hypothetical protein